MPTFTEELSMAESEVVPAKAVRCPTLVLLIQEQERWPVCPQAEHALCTFSAPRATPRLRLDGAGPALGEADMRQNGRRFSGVPDPQWGTPPSGSPLPPPAEQTTTAAAQLLPLGGETQTRAFQKRAQLPKSSY